MHTRCHTLLCLLWVGLFSLSGCTNGGISLSQIGHAQRVGGDPEKTVLVQDAKFNSDENLWDLLPEGFQLPTSYENKSDVQSQIRWFVNHQDYLDRTTERAKPYMYMIYVEVLKRGLPTELVLLPIVESAYHPLAHSGAGASGLWQIMPGTARALGLHRDSWYDGRRDVFASTNAALDHLIYLRDYFDGNWLLALAAYDAGEGTVRNAIRRNAEKGLPTDFWSLKLPAETRAYIPQMLALAAIVRDRTHYGVVLPPIPAMPYLGQVDVGKQIRLQEAAHLAGISLEELKKLNPGYRRVSTSPSGYHKLLLPLENISDFQDNLKIVRHSDQIEWSRYRVQNGDTIEKIAERYNTTPKKIRLANHLSDNAYAAAGRVLHIPHIEKKESKQSEAPVDKTQVQPSLFEKLFVAPVAQIAPVAAVSSEQSAPVVNRDTSVEQKTEAKEAQQTTTSEETNLSEKTEAVINKTERAAEKPSAKASTTRTTLIRYTVNTGDTLSHIAEKYHVRVKDIQRWNRLKPNAPIRVGSRLVIYTKTKIANEIHHTKIAEKKTYAVQKGDTLSAIAKKLKMSVKELQAMNPGLEATRIRPGQQLLISQDVSSHE